MDNKKSYLINIMMTYIKYLISSLVILGGGHAIIISNGNSVEQFTLNTNSANFNVEELHSIANFQLGATPGEGYMRYKKVSNGYDLYI